MEENTHTISLATELNPMQHTLAKSDIIVGYLQCVDTIMTFDAAKWISGIDELSSCVRKNILLDHDSRLYSEHFWNKFTS